jgi:hypothetical protein
MFNTTFIIFGTLMVVLESLSIGYHLAKNQGLEVASDGLLAGLWILLVFFMALDRFREQRRDLHDHNDAVEALAEKVMDKITSEVDPETKQNIDELVKVMMEITPAKPPTTDEQLQAVMAAYHEKTGRTVALSFRRDDAGNILGMDSEFSDTETAPEAAGKAPAHKVPVVAEDAPKPLTKSQQRRINDKKGRGPITDDEWKQQQNEKRRAARAARAAEPDETQPTLKEKIAAGK